MLPKWSPFPVNGTSRTSPSSFLVIIIEKLSIRLSETWGWFNNHHGFMVDSNGGSNSWMLSEPNDRAVITVSVHHISPKLSSFRCCKCFWTLSSVESKKGVIAVQRCYVENQMGAIAVLAGFMAIAPFWFSAEYLWNAITPFFLLTDSINVKF